MQRILRYTTAILLISLMWANMAFGQQQELGKGKSLLKLSDQDVILPITAIEWGYPDRWSFTSRYIHAFQKGQTSRTWHHNFDISLSPGISGGRLGAGYLGLYSPPSYGGDSGLFYHLNGVLLRTWGNPLSTEPDTTFIGGELKIGFSLCNFSFGYYSPTANSDVDAFWGVHFGIGI